MGNLEAGLRCTLRLDGFTSGMDEPVILVVTTFPDMENARRIAAGLVETGHAACVNLLPGVESFFRWEGKIHHDNEVVGLIKTTRAALPGLQDALRGLHPYTCPESLVFPADGGLEAYLDWVRASVGQTADPGLR